MRLLPVSHIRQRKFSDCLIACAAMVLQFIGQNEDYEHIGTLLKSEPHGTVFSHLRFLETSTISVRLGRGSIQTLTDYLDDGIPLITAVETGELTSYWQESCSHALVVVGATAEKVFVNDPEYSFAPQEIDIEEFELAWQEMDYRFATIQHKHS